MIDILTDKYMTFTWKDKSSEEYNCYIENAGEDLHWVSTPSFSDNFVQTLGQHTAYYTGTTIGNKSLSFKVFGYNRTLEEIRKILQWLDIHDISELRLGYDNDFHYNCKISSLSELHYWNIDPSHYICEFTITFVTVGDPYAVTVLKDKKNSGTDLKQIILGKIEGEIPTGFELILSKLQWDKTATTHSIKVSLTKQVPTINGSSSEISITLYNIVFNSSMMDKNPSNQLQSITYNSQNGLLLYGNKLLQSVEIDKKLIVDSCQSLSNIALDSTVQSYQIHIDLTGINLSKSSAVCRWREKTYII